MVCILLHQKNGHPALGQLAQRLLDSPERFDTDAYWRIQVVTGDGLMLTSLHLTEITAPAAQRPVPRRE